MIQSLLIAITMFFAMQIYRMGINGFKIAIKTDAYRRIIVLSLLLICTLVVLFHAITETIKLLK